MTAAEKLTLERVDQKVDDLVGRFDRMIKLTQWFIGTFIIGITAIATIYMAVKN